MRRWRWRHSGHARAPAAKLLSHASKARCMTVADRLVARLAFLRRNGGARTVVSHEAPLRAELFSAEQMEQHGATLASAHALGPKRRRDLLLPRLAENEAVLTDACALLTGAIKAEQP